MNFKEILRAIFINIMENKFKVFLTTLGIIVGALTIVIVLAIGRGSQKSVEEQFKNLNVGTITIGQGFGKRTTEKLDSDLVEKIKEEVPEISKITMIINENATAIYDGQSTSVGVMGAYSDIKDINNLELEYGEFFTSENDENRDKVAVIGYGLAELFFPDDVSEAVGNSVIINGRRYKVVGVLKDMNDATVRGFSADEGVIIPYSVAEKNISGRFARPMILALAKDFDSVSSAIDGIEGVLQKVYKDSADDFMIMDAGSRLESAKASAKTLTLLLLSVATVVLIVGGIGIMNVLFVSVKERTKEIGILKAIGARRRDILLMFLLEAIIISAAGGIIGIVLGVLTMPLLKYFQINAYYTNFGYILAFAFSVTIGTFFGYYPAAKASTLKPIDALNYE